MNANLTKPNQNTTPKLDYADQPIGTDLIIFTTKCEREIEVAMQSVLDYIDATEINVQQDCDGAYWDPESITTERIIEAKEYLFDNFEQVTKMYFDQVVVLTMQEASQVIQGYTSSLVHQNLPVDQAAINHIMALIKSEYGIKMNVA